MCQHTHQVVGEHRTQELRLLHPVQGTRQTDDSVHGTLHGYLVGGEELVADLGDRGQERHRVVQLELVHVRPDALLARSLGILSGAEHLGEPGAIAPWGKSLAIRIIVLHVAALPEVLERLLLASLEPGSDRVPRGHHLVVERERHLCAVRRVTGQDGHRGATLLEGSVHVLGRRRVELVVRRVVGQEEGFLGGEPPQHQVAFVVDLDATHDGGALDLACAQAILVTDQELRHVGEAADQHQTYPLVGSRLQEHLEQRAAVGEAAGVCDVRHHHLVLLKVHVGSALRAGGDEDVFAAEYVERSLGDAGPVDGRRVVGHHPGEVEDTGGA